MTKSEQRQLALAARRALSAEERADFSAAICRRLSFMLYKWRGRTVLSYLAQPDEADLSGLTGFVTAYPVTGPGGHMEAYVPRGEEPFEIGRFGIRQPRADTGTAVPPEAVDIVLAPCVAFDKKCRRLGHGGGYYDRYLQRCPKALVIAVAFEAQRLDEIVTDGHDVPAHIIVTEEQAYLLQ